MYNVRTYVCMYMGSLHELSNGGIIVGRASMLDTIAQREMLLITIARLR